MPTKEFTYKNFAFNTSPDIMDVSNYYSWDRYRSLSSLFKEVYSDNIQSLVGSSSSIFSKLGRKKCKKNKKK